MINKKRYFIIGAVVSLSFIFTYMIYAIIQNLSTDTTLGELCHISFPPGFLVVLAGSLVERKNRCRKRIETKHSLPTVEQIAASIVHDLKNPLIVILGFTKRIRERKGNVENAAQAIIEAAEDMQKIVNEVLDFSKPIRLNMLEEDIRNVIQRSVVTCETQAKERGVKISLHMPAQAVKSIIDRSKIQRALINLISNAIEASSIDNPVEISLTRNEQFITITITDYGSGMDKKTLNNIFTPFYTKKRRGTGFGIPLSEKIIEGHNGRIIIDSTAGQGTKIAIILPLLTHHPSK